MFGLRWFLPGLSLFLAGFGWFQVGLAGFGWFRLVWGLINYAFYLRFSIILTLYQGHIFQSATDAVIFLMQSKHAHLNPREYAPETFGK